MFSKVLVALFALVCLVTAQQEKLTIGGHPFVAWNVTAPHVLMLYHGLGNPVEEYYGLADHFGRLGYAVVLPTDCEHDVGILPMVVEDWVKSTVAGVQKEFTKGRPLAILGHSMGGGAAMAAARFTRGLAAYVSVHGAPILSGGYVPFAPAMSGPILFITGTLEIIDNAGFTSQWTSAGSYDFAQSPKALINVKGNGHMAIVGASFGGMEGVASEKWLDCFARKAQLSCDWLGVELCNKSADGKFVNGLQWCRHNPSAFKPLTLNETMVQSVIV